MHVDPCGKNSGSKNEDWELSPNGTISSLQANTPFCLGAKGTVVGATAVLDACGASSADFQVNFTKGGIFKRSTVGTIVQKASSLCLTVITPPVPPHEDSYQPMVRPPPAVAAASVASASYLIHAIIDAVPETQ